MPTLNRKQLRFLLVQIRDDERVRSEEVQSFLHYGGLDAEQLTVLNVFDRPQFERDVGRGFDAVLVGGASEASVLERQRYPFVDSIIGLLRWCIEVHKPVFASCFGFQAAGLGLGAEVTFQDEGFEMGTLPMQLTEHAADDPLFCDAPEGFVAVTCHRESLLHAPQGCLALAHSDRFCQAFRVVERPFWAFQFHPELDCATFVSRLGIYRKQYTDTDDHYESTIASFRETPVSNQLLGKFIDRVVLPK